MLSKVQFPSPSLVVLLEECFLNLYKHATFQTIDRRFNYIHLSLKRDSLLLTFCLSLSKPYSIWTTYPLLSFINLVPYIVSLSGPPPDWLLTYREWPGKSWLHPIGQSKVIYIAALKGRYIRHFTKFRDVFISRSESFLYGAGFSKCWMLQYFQPKGTMQ